MKFNYVQSFFQEKRKHISFMGIIFGSKDGSRFGATIAADDVDGDKFPGLMISLYNQIFMYAVNTICDLYIRLQLHF